MRLPRSRGRVHDDILAVPFNPAEAKGGFKSEDTGKILCLQHKYSKSLFWAENLNKLFTVLGGKFKSSAQDSDMEYLCWRWKNSPVSSDLKPPLKYDGEKKWGYGSLWFHISKIKLKSLYIKREKKNESPLGFAC